MIESTADTEVLEVGMFACGLTPYPSSTAAHRMHKNVRVDPKRP